MCKIIPSIAFPTFVFTSGIRCDCDDVDEIGAELLDSDVVTDEEVDAIVVVIIVVVAVVVIIWVTADWLAIVLSFKYFQFHLKNSLQFHI